MSIKLAAIVLAGAVFASLSGPALAQSTPSEVPAAKGETQDSGVGDTDTGAWVGKPVVSADGTEIGTLTEVRALTENTDGGTLAIRRAGGDSVEAPLAGASFDGSRVTVVTTTKAIDAPPAASVN